MVLYNLSAFCVTCDGILLSELVFAKILKTSKLAKMSL